jgi:hypothetical protein
MQTASKSRVTNAEATVVQLPNIAASDKGDVILCRAPFLFLFWRSKKEKEKIKLLLFFLLPYVNSFLFCLDTKKKQKKSRQNECSAVLPGQRHVTSILFSESAYNPNRFSIVF